MKFAKFYLAGALALATACPALADATVKVTLWAWPAWVLTSM
jgi:hypothetical protein